MDGCASLLTVKGSWILNVECSSVARKIRTKKEEEETVIILMTWPLCLRGQSIMKK